MIPICIPATTRCIVYFSLILLLCFNFFFGRTLELHLTYSPISLFRWQMYESQRVRQKWFSVLGDEPEQTEEEQDSLKVSLALEAKVFFISVLSAVVNWNVCWTSVLSGWIKPFQRLLCCVLVFSCSDVLSVSER